MSKEENTTNKEDYTFVTHLDHGKPVECYICGISSFDHIHRAGKKPKDFERLEDTNINKEEWEKEFFGRFGANKIWVAPSRDNVETILDIHSFISKLLSSHTNKAVEEETKRLNHIADAYATFMSDVMDGMKPNEAYQHYEETLQTLKDNDHE